MEPRDTTPPKLRHLHTTVTRHVVVAGSVLAVIARVCDEETQGRETGGILLGHQHTDGHLSVTQAGDPGPLAERTASRFRRDAAHAGLLSSAAYARDRSVWLGDWHTHPTGPSRPSPVDMAAYASVLRDESSGFETFLSVIVLPEAAGPVLYPWAVTLAGGRQVGLWVDRSY